MSYTAFDSLTLCTPSDVDSEIGSILAIAYRANPLSANTDVAKAIANVQTDIKRALILKLRGSFATTVTDLMNMARDQWIAARQQYNTDSGTTGSVSMAVSIWTDYFNASAYANWYVGQSLLPGVWVTDVAPTNGTSGDYAGYAANGDFLANLISGFVYVNQGTSDSPTWVKFTPDMLVDFITNPEQLRQAAIHNTIVQCLQNITVLQMSDQLLHSTLARLDYWKPLAAQMLNECIQMITVDVGNVGAQAEVPPYFVVALQGNFGFGHPA